MEKNLQHYPCKRRHQCFSFVKLSYVDTAVPVDTVHSDVLVCMFCDLLTIQKSERKGKGGERSGTLTCYFDRWVGAYSGEGTY